MVAMEQSSTNYTTESDDALLIYIGMQQDCPDEAREAWGVFYERHRNYVLKLCNWKYYRNGDIERIENLATETFFLVWQSAAKYDACGETEPSKLQRKTRAWLGCLAFKAHRRIYAIEANQPVSDELIDMRPAPKELKTTSPSNDEQVREAISALSERDQIVLRTLIFYKDQSRPLSHTPDAELHKLAKEFDTTTDNIRQIFHRAKKKVFIALAEKKEKRGTLR
jgi:DNA-directed RNA polymerase specialized sigma24 family protein